MGSGPDDPTEHDVLAQAKAAVAAGDRAAALALLRQLQEGSSTAAQGTPALAEALVATARETADAEDQAARRRYAQAQEARSEIVRLLHETPFDEEDLAAIRAVLDKKDAALEQATAQRREQAVALGAATARRLGAGWLDEKRIQRRLGAVPRLPLPGRQDAENEVPGQGGQAGPVSPPRPLGEQRQDTGFTAALPKRRPLSCGPAQRQLRNIALYSTGTRPLVHQHRVAEVLDPRAGRSTPEVPGEP